MFVNARIFKTDEIELMTLLSAGALATHRIWSCIRDKLETWVRQRDNVGDDSYNLTRVINYETSAYETLNTHIVRAVPSCNSCCQVEWIQHSREQLQEIS